MKRLSYSGFRETLLLGLARLVVVDLVDLLFRRVGLGWTRSMAADASRKCAEAVCDILGWDAARVDAEVAAYADHLDRQHAFRPVGPG